MIKYIKLKIKDFNIIQNKKNNNKFIELIKFQIILTNYNF
jgi:hypothetical protein